MSDTLLEAVNQSQAEMYASKGAETPAAETTPAITETPVVAPTETTAAPVTETVTAEPAKFDATEFAKQTFGTDNLEEVKTRYTGYEAVLTEKQKIEQQYNEAKALAPANDLERFYIDGLRKGVKPEILAKVYSLDVEKMSNEDKVKNWMAIEKPYLTPEQVNALYKKDYEVNPDAIDAEEEKLLKDAHLADAAFKAGTGLKDWTNKTMNPEPAKVLEAQETESQQQLEARTTAWKAVAPKLTESVSKVSKTIPIAMFDTKAGEEKQYELKYVVPAEKQQKYIDLAINNYIKAGVEVNDKNVTEIMQYANRIMKSEEADNMAIAFANDAISVFLQDFKARFNNTQLRSQGDLGGGGKSDAVEAAVLAQISKM
jgi:hypothetical protein